MEDVVISFSSLDILFPKWAYSHFHRYWLLRSEGKREGRCVSFWVNSAHIGEKVIWDD